MRLPPARRLVRAAMLACVTGVLLGAAVGASNGAEAQSTPAIHVPAPRLGDRGAYTAHLDASYADVPGAAAALPFLAFEWLPGTATRMGDGLVHDTERIRTSGWTYQGWALEANRLQENSDASGWPGIPVWVRHNQTLVLAQGSADLLATEDDLHEVRSDNATVPRSDLGGGVGPVTGGVGLVQQATVTNGTQRQFGPGGSADCLFLNGFQNRTIALGDRVSFAGACDLHGVLTLVGAWGWRAAAVEAVQGVPALRLEPIDFASSWQLGGDGGTGFHTGAVTVWLADGIPYPVRMAWGAGGGGSSLELSGYEAGTQPRLPATAPRDPAPETAFAPPRAWGPDEAGVRHPFPLSAAYLGARDDPQFPSLRDYLASRPDAFVASARHSMAASERTGTERTWWFTVTDGKSWLDVTATRTDGPQAPLGLPLSPPLEAPGMAAANTTYSAGMVQRGNQYYAGPYPTPQEASGQLPTVASLMARWQAYASQDYAARGPDTWGFHVTCFRVLEAACRSVWVSAWAGHADATTGPTQADTATAPPTLRTTRDGHVSLLTLFDGRTQALTETWQVADERTGIPAAPPLPDSGAAGPAAPRPSASLAAWVPTPGQAAGVGATAVAVGLLYYLWPLAKGGLGLFSRLREPEVLGHPARQRLLQVIEAEPGIHFKEMARRSGLPNGSLVHHLETLRRSGQVVARPSGGYTLYFLGAHVPAGSAEAASALKADGARRILETVRRQPGLSSADVAARCGLQPSTVAYHVQRLQAAGLLTGLRDGRALRLHPAEAAAAAVA